MLPWNRVHHPVETLFTMVVWNTQSGFATARARNRPRQKAGGGCAAGLEWPSEYLGNCPHSAIDRRFLLYPHRRLIRVPTQISVDPLSAVIALVPPRMMHVDGLGARPIRDQRIGYRRRGATRFGVHHRASS